LVHSRSFSDAFNTALSAVEAITCACKQTKWCNDREAFTWKRFSLCAHLLRACARIDTSSSLNMDGSSSVANVNGGSCASAVPQAEWKVMAKDLFAGTVRLVLADDQTLLAAA